jgi:hypothetical protein
MYRPVGVTILAILEFIGSGICALLGILVIVGAGAGLLGSMTQGQGSGLGSLMAVIGGALSVFCFIFAAIGALLGWGLWTLKNWARIILIVLASLGALGSLLALLNLSSAIIVGVVIRLAINGLVIWYLLQPNVAAAFQGGQARTVSA